MILPAILLLAQSPVSAGNGAISITKLCAELRRMTGEPHDITAPFFDHSLYLRLSKPTPERLRKVTADCLRGEWVHKRERWQLIAATPPEIPEWFPDAWTKAYDPAGKRTDFAPNPIRLYSLRVGDQQINGGKLIRRLMGTTYEAGQTQWVVENPLPDVVEWLGDRKERVVKVPDAIKPRPRMGGTSLNAGTERWQKDGPDILAVTSSELLSATADAVGGEVAFPIPDGLALAGFMFQSDQRLGQALKSLSQWMEFSVEGNTLVGKLTAADAGARTQANRAAIIASCDPMPEFFDTPVLAKFEAEQPPLASQAVNDVMALMMGGASLDATPHYPWDMRLYRNLSNADWNVLRREGTMVGDLSAAATLALDNLASKSRMMLEDPIPFENGTIPRRTPINLAEIVEQALVVYYGDRSPEVMDILNVAGHRTWDGYNDKVATFLPVRRRLLTIVVGDSSKISFSKVELPADRTPVRFSKLPAALREQIQTAERSQNDQRGKRVPPPVF